MNKVIIMGRITRQLELRKTQNNKSVLSFSVAVDRGYNKLGEEKLTDFINVVCWGKTADFVATYFIKGQLIALEGALQTRQYQDSKGNTRYITEVVADNVYFTGDRRKTETETKTKKYQYQEKDNFPF